MACDLWPSAVPPHSCVSVPLPRALGPEASSMCQVGPCPGPFLSQAPETNTGSTASVRPAQEEQSTTPPGKVVTVSSRSPRCPRNQAALRHSKAFSPSSVPCSSGEARLATCGAGPAGAWGLHCVGHRLVDGVRVQNSPPPHGEGESRAQHKSPGALGVGAGRRCGGP